jgi:hypothetical protein
VSLATNVQERRKTASQRPPRVGPIPGNLYGVARVSKRILLTALWPPTIVLLRQMFEEKTASLYTAFLECLWLYASSIRAKI